MADIAFHHPATVDEAVSILAAAENGRFLAGGQTLVAMMNAGLLDVSTLVVVSGIDELGRIGRIPDGRIRIGAGVCHRAVAHAEDLSGANSVVRQAASVIAHPAIRNFGTIGGSLAHADPAADYPAAVMAAAAVVEVAGAGGRREIPIEKFFLDYLTTTLEPGELVTAVILPEAATTTSGCFLKFSRVDGDYAIASVAVTIDMDGGKCRGTRIALGGCGPTPVFSSAANEALLGTSCDADAVELAASRLVEVMDPVDDVRASEAYRRRIVPKLVQRAMKEALKGISKGAGS
jgi:carbon-monoxide dehydrogenase medium subunit